MYLKGELRYWFTEYNWNVCATLTFADNTSNQRRERLLNLFLNKLDRKLHGNWVRKENRKCSRIVFAENNFLGTHLHYHLALIIPNNYKGNIIKFCRELMRLWRSICGRSKIAEFKPIDDSMGWIDYITKDTMADNCDNWIIQSSVLSENDLLTK